MAKRTRRKQPFTPADIRRFRFVSDPMVHPAGDRVAYVLRTVDRSVAENRYRSGIRLTRPSGGRARPLTAEEMDSDSPLWSPDGQQLLFLSKRLGDEKRQLYLLPADGGEARRLTAVEGGVFSATWSPDSRLVAFRAFCDPRAVERGAARPFADDVQVIGSAFWRLNGVGSWLDKQLHLFVVPARGGRPRQLTEGPWNVGGLYISSDGVAFSLDGERIYYLATPDPEDDWAMVRRADIHVVNVDGSDRRRITDFPGVFLAVRESPSGELLTIGSDLARGWASPNRLWRVDPESGAYEAVLPDLDLSLGDSMNCDVRFPSRPHDPWISADGRRARVRITQRSAVRLAEVDLEQRTSAWMTPEEESVLGWHSTPDGGVRVEIRSTVTRPPDLWAVEGERAPRRITRHNDRLLAARRIYPATPIPFRASDGTEVEGWILQPTGRRKGGRPAVLEIHGGPKTAYGHAFSLEFQMLAGAGYAVLFSNPRGSDGYGTGWAEAVYGRYGERDYEDLMEFIDHGLGRDLGLDPGRLAVIGGSYGGFMTNWIIGHTGRFRSAVSQRGISNWESFFGTSDIGYFFNPEHVGGLPWEAPEQYRAKSPLTYAERVHTPLLLIHSEQDLRCPIEQAEQFFIYLRRLGRPVKLARFPEETHELSRSGTPNRRMERLRLILAWFREWL